MARKWQTFWVVVLCGALISLLTTGMRQSFGLFLHPVTIDNGWGREVFSLALAIYTLVQGLGAPLMGSVSDRYGAGRVLVLGGLLWALGLAGMSWPTRR